jgi:hypothetical protein
MPIEVTCASCGQRINVADSLIGKQIRCQTCNSVFLAEEDVAMEVVEEPLDQVIVVEEPPTGGVALAVESSGKASGNEAEYEEAQRRRPRRKKRQQRTDAVDLVYWPGLLLTITGYVGSAINAVGIIYNLVNATQALIASASSPGPRGGGVPVAAFVIIAFQALATVVWGGIVVKGGQSLSSLENYSTAIMACVVACLPCSVGCCFGLPLGIWGFVVLSQNHVRMAFDK